MGFMDAEEENKQVGRLFRQHFEQEAILTKAKAKGGKVIQEQFAIKEK